MAEDSEIPECSGSLGHNWKTVRLEVKGRGSSKTQKYQECQVCGIFRVSEDVELYYVESSPKEDKSGGSE